MIRRWQCGACLLEYEVTGLTWLRVCPWLDIEPDVLRYVYRDTRFQPGKFYACTPGSDRGIPIELPGERRCDPAAARQG